MWKGSSPVKKILVVDDSELSRVELRNLFEAEGFEIIEAENGQQGADIYRSDHTIDLVISDYNMPKMNGIEMAKEIKDASGDSSPPVLLITSESAKEKKEVAKSYGVVGWVVKPFAPEKLVKMVKTIVERYCSP